MSEKLDVKPIPVALQRLIDEIKAEKPTDTSLYNRSYHRHNR